MHHTPLSTRVAVIVFGGPIHIQHYHGNNINTGNRFFFLSQGMDHGCFGGSPPTLPILVSDKYSTSDRFRFSFSSTISEIINCLKTLCTFPFSNVWSLAEDGKTSLLQSCCDTPAISFETKR